MIGKVNTGGDILPYAIIKCYYTPGYTCTCTCGTRVLRSKTTTGYWVFKVPKNGVWILEGKSGYRKSVEITDKQRQVTCHILVPEEYQQVESITSNGNQYIDTTLKGTQFDEILIDLKLPNTSNTELFFACENGSSGGRNYIGKNASQWIVGAHNNYNTSVTYVANTKYSLKVRTGKTTADIASLEVDGTPRWSKQVESATRTENTARIFAQNGGGTASAKAKMTLYALTAKNLGSVVLNGIPCYAKATSTTDKIVGLYDTVSDTFLVNSGTGVFEAGEDVI